MGSPGFLEHRTGSWKSRKFSFFIIKRDQRLLHHNRAMHFPHYRTKAVICCNGRSKTPVQGIDVFHPPGEWLVGDGDGLLGHGDFDLAGLDGEEALLALPAPLLHTIPALGRQVLVTGGQVPPHTLVRTGYLNTNSIYHKLNVSVHCVVNTTILPERSDRRRRCAPRCRGLPACKTPGRGRPQCGCPGSEATGARGTSQLASRNLAVQAQKWRSCRPVHCIQKNWK